MATLVLTGAGNVELTRCILSDLFVVPEMAGTLRVVLHDIDRERLDTARVLADRLNAEARAGAVIEAHMDRRAAFEGADFVVCTLSVGGFEGTLRDFEIPARYGVRQTIADTIGIGGIFRGLRTIPVLVDIAADMMACCPDAWLLSYTDPLVMSLWAVREATGLTPARTRSAAWASRWGRSSGATAATCTSTRSCAAAWPPAGRC